MVYKVVLAFDSVHEIPRKCDNSNAPVVQFTFLYKLVTGTEFNTFTGNLGQHVNLVLSISRIPHAHLPTISKAV